jgi:hypothetical protein
MGERNLAKKYIYDPIYLLVIISTLLLFFSALIHSPNVEIWASTGITIIIICYFLIGFIFVLMFFLWLMTAVKGRYILREYKRGLKKKKKLPKNN